MYDYSFDWQFTIAPDQHRTPRACGYLLGLTLGSSAKLGADLHTPAVYTDPHGSYPGLAGAYEAAGKTVSSCGVLESLQWSGAAADPIHLSFFVGEKNRAVLHEFQGAITSEVRELRFWVVGYESAAGAGSWFEGAYPIGSWPSGQEGLVRGRLVRNADSLAFQLSETAVEIRDARTKMYECRLSLVPPTDGTYTLFSAESKTAKVVQPWGLKIAK
ncbi:hypothetical protein [Nocardia inohanensis]|uniref:hypothetical protein n=1 Tax=Nocardia inohanensis TaxID=209246 RepID=UPI00082F17B9|nr:hypothetical protein [Nocardia inohanensis]